MIQLFEIKKKVKQMKNTDKELLEKYTETSKKNKEEILKEYNTKEEGLTQKEYEKRYEQNGPNIVVKNEKKSWIEFFIKSFNDKFIYILLILALIDFVLSDKLGAGIIVGIAVVSAFIKFCQNYSTYKFNQKLKAQIYSSTNVVRSGKEKEVRVENIAIGDIIKLNAGSIIPADVILIESKDLFLNQSVFTGESVLVEKTTTSNEPKGIFDINNICLMGSSVVSGSGTAVVIQTGFDTYLGRMSKEIDNKKEITNFEKGMNNITKLLIKYMVVVSIAVFVIYAFIRHDLMEALLFALSVAVGITPSMLPMIVNVNLTKGSKTLAKKKTLVKNIQSIQNLGAIDILCTDKTGTLTQDKITLQKYINVMGEEDIDILKYAYLNSYYGTGIKNLVDKAVIAYGNQHKIKQVLKEYEKVDEIPFDYTRKRMSVVVKNEDGYRMLTKGAIEEILKCCKQVKYKDEIIPITEDLVKQIEVNANNLSNMGMQVIALATKKAYPGVNIFNSSDESEMTFVGYVAFLDPPKKDVKKTINDLKKIGVKTKILTGDNAYATKNICNTVGLRSDRIITGVELDQMPDEELEKAVEEVDVFARLNPLQKERVVKTYKKNGHVVGYMGDGVNDAPSLHTADVGICVDSATDIAKEASDIILLEKSLQVIYDGVIEGRKVYGNIIKYIKMTASSNFGNMLSVLAASIFLPFLPMLPIQILVLNLIYDISCISIPWDNMDPEFLKCPRKWDSSSIGKFMIWMGPVSSIFDIITYVILYFVICPAVCGGSFGAPGVNSVLFMALFHAGWFVESLWSQTLVIHMIRTPKVPFIQSRASLPVLVITTIAIIVGTVIPYTPLGAGLGMAALPAIYFAWLAGIIFAYMVLITVVKKIFVKKYGDLL